MSALTDMEADVAWHRDYLEQMRRAYNLARMKKE